MKTTIKYFVIIISACILNACEFLKNHYDDIPDDKKLELMKNDTLLFIDSLSAKIDTFQTHYSDLYEISDSRYYTEVIQARYNLLNNTKNSNGFLITQHYKGVFIQIKLNVTAKDYDYIYFDKDQSNLTIGDIEVQGVMYPNTYVLNQYHFETDTLPKTVYYSLKHGIVRYDYADGRKYELISK